MINYGSKSFGSLIIHLTLDTLKGLNNIILFAIYISGLDYYKA